MNPETLTSLEKENIAFKKLTPEDWLKFRAIRLKGLETDPQAFGSLLERESQEENNYWKERLTNPSRSIYVAEKDGVFVAIAGLRNIDQKEQTVFGVYTLPEFRGKGISQQLLSSLIEEARNNNAHKLNLLVNMNLENSVNLYKKIGFKIIKTEKEHAINGVTFPDSYFMEMEL